MRSFANIIKHSLLRLAITLTALLVGMTFFLATSVASAAVVMIDINKVVFAINKVVFVKPQPVVNVIPSTSKVEVQPVVKPEVKADSRAVVVRPFFVRPLAIRPFNIRSSEFNPFFNEEFFGFGE